MTSKFFIGTATNAIENWSESLQTNYPVLAEEQFFESYESVRIEWKMDKIATQGFEYLKILNQATGPLLLATQFVGTVFLT